MTHNVQAIATGPVGAGTRVWIGVEGEHIALSGGHPRSRVLAASMLISTIDKAKALWVSARAIFRVSGEVLRSGNSVVGKSSLSSRGLRVHFDVAVALISVIPMLAFSYVFVFDPPMSVKVPIFVLSIGLVVFGYWMMGTYPKTLLKLHDYLRQVANGEMPKVACLMEEEKDIVATEHYLNLILNVMRDKIRTIEEQKQQIADIERKKAIAESLCTACHYLGQPATVIVAYLDLMEREEFSPPVKEMVSQCQIAGASITRILSALNQATVCQSEPYLSGEQTDADSSDERILRIDGLSEYEMAKVASN